MKNLFLLTLLLFSTSVSARTLDPGTPIRCTRDINPWGHPSRCTCLSETYKYDETVGYCLKPVLENTKLEEGLYKMFETPNHQLGQCDIGTQLVLSENSQLGSLALTENFLHGTCEIYVPSQPSYTKLKYTGANGCGVKSYEGVRLTMDGQVKVEVFDYRNLKCRMMPPARVVMKQTYPNGQEFTTYSKDR